MSEHLESTTYEFEGFRLEVVNRKLFVCETGELIPLQPKAAELLLFLIENEGRILTKNEILDTVWAESFVEEANLTQTIFILRKVLNDDTKKPRFIVTVPHKGYRFIGKIEKISAEFQNANPDNQIPITKNNFAIYLLPAIPLVLLTVFGFYYFLQPDRKPAAINEIKSIAVLPFQNIGGKQDEEYLGNGLSEVLISKLSSIKTIVVRPVNSVLKFTEASPDTKKIGNDLNVEAIVTGRVQRIGENIRVTVQLVRVSDDATIWAGTFDDRFTNIFAVQDSISNKVTESLALKLTKDEKELITKKFTVDSEAFGFYLRGRYFWNKRTVSDFQKAIENYNQAIEKDPNYALAFAGLASCYILLPEYGGALPQETFPKAKEAINKALKLDNNLAEAHAALGYTQAFYDWNWQDAEKSFKRAIELNPNYATAYQWYAEFLSEKLRFDEAKEHFARAMQIDPTSPIILNSVGHFYFNARLFDQSIELEKKCIELEPKFGLCYSNMAFAYEQKEMIPQALEAHFKALQLYEEPADSIEEIKQSSNRDGIKGFWKTRLEQFHNRPHLKNFPANTKAFCYAKIGDKENALKWLKISMERRERYLTTAAITPVYHLLHDDPRFLEMLRQMGLKPLTK